MFTCVTVDQVSQFVRTDETCSSGLVLMPVELAVGIATNPLAIPLEVAGPMLWATLGLFITAFAMRQLRKALD